MTNFVPGANLEGQGVHVRAVHADFRRGGCSDHGALGVVRRDSATLGLVGHEGRTLGVGRGAERPGTQLDVTDGGLLGVRPGDLSLVGGAAVPLLEPFVPVFPVHFDNLTLLVFAPTSALPDSLEQVMPVFPAAAAGFAASAVTPTTGIARPATAATDPRTNFILSTLTFLHCCVVEAGSYRD